MNIKDQKLAVDRVRCSICMKEIPISEAIVPEATDYLVNFCGLTCYDKWKSQPDNPAAFNNTLFPSKPK
ncbi:DUF3330 domain-containing protein [Zwartia sp.]|uniref:DUF3330 domain-containing protein n=1 Tax=Zwartia sp. TaxID=2978004 RepID=UPI0039185D82